MAINLIYYFVRLLITWIKTCRRFCNWYYLGGLLIPPRKVILLSRIFSTSSPSVHISASWQSFIRVIDACRASFYTKKAKFKICDMITQKSVWLQFYKKTGKKKLIIIIGPFTPMASVWAMLIILCSRRTRRQPFFFFFFLQFPIEYYVRIGRDNKHADYLQ